MVDPLAIAAVDPLGTAMQAFPFLRAGTPARLLKDYWAKDKPLSKNEGGTCDAVSADAFSQVKTSLQNGGNWMALGCLTDIANELSLANLKFDAQTIEGLGRKLFGTQNGIWADKLPSLPNDLGIPEDNYWAENTVQYPAAWPEKLVLPVGLVDLNSLPSKYRLLAGDEGVLAFWKFIDHLERLLKTARDQLHAEM